MLAIVRRRQYAGPADIVRARRAPGPRRAGRPSSVLIRLMTTPPRTWLDLMTVVRRVANRCGAIARHSSRPRLDCDTAFVKPKIKANKNDDASVANVERVELDGVPDVDHPMTTTLRSVARRGL